jgi:hypothetical protein
MYIHRISYISTEIIDSSSYTKYFMLAFSTHNHEVKLSVSFCQPYHFRHADNRSLSQLTTVLEQLASDMQNKGA